MIHSPRKYKSRPQILWFGSRSQIRKGSYCLVLSQTKKKSIDYLPEQNKSSVAIAFFSVTLRQSRKCMQYIQSPGPSVYVPNFDSAARDAAHC